MNRPGLWALANVSAALIFGAVVAATLHGRVRDLGMTAPLGTNLVDGPTLIPLPVSSSNDEAIARSAVLRVQQAVPAGLYEIRIRVDTYGSTPRLTAGTLRLGETCAFEAEAETLHTEDPVIFRRTKPCDGVPVGTAATLSLRFSESRVQDARCALLGFSVQGNAHLLGIEFNGRHYALLGWQTTLRSEAIMTRASLLAYMWGRATGFVWLAFGAAEVLIVAAGALLAFRRDVLTAAALTALAGSLALAYAVLVPPLQAPDEPNHLLGYAQMNENESLAAESARWAQALHFERLTFQSEQHFRPSDVTQPHASPWGAHVTPVDEVSRAPFNARYWQVLARWLGEAGPAGTVLGVRLANAVLFAVFAGIACLLVSLPRNGSGAYLIPLALLLVPTLPFFAMHMSNYALLTDGYVLIAVALAGLSHGKTESAGVGFMLGFGSSLALATSLSSLALLALVMAGLLAAVLGRPALSPPRPRYYFWVMFVLGAVAISVAPSGSDPLSKTGVFRDSAFRLLSAWPWIAIGIGLAGVAVDALSARIRRGQSQGASVVPARVLQLIAAVIAIVALISVVHPFPGLRPMEVRDRWPTPSGYALEVLQASLTLGRLSHPDLFLSSSFWARFGWLDTYPGDWLTNLLTGATVAALVGLLLATARARDNKKALRLLLVGCGAIAALTIYGMGSSVQRTNLHGRYLFGLYLCGVATCWSVLALAAPSGAPRRLSAATTFLFIAIAGIHAVCLTFILHRYF